MVPIIKISRDIFLKAASNISFIVLSLFISVFLNRHYGKNTYGLLVLVYSVTNFCFFFSDLGAKQTINRFLPMYLRDRDKLKLNNLIGAALLYQLIGIIFFSVLLTVCANFVANVFFMRPELNELIRVGILFFIAYSLMDFVFQIFQAFQSWGKESLLNIVYLSFYLGLVYLFIFLFDISLKGVLFANSISCIIIVVLGIILLPKNLNLSGLLEQFRISRIMSEGKTIITFGSPLLFNNVTFFILMWFDKALLGRYGVITEVTFYYIAFSFYAGIMIIFKTLYSVFMPYLAGIPVTSTEQIQRYFKLIFRWFFHCAVLISIAAFFIVEPLVRLLYGADYLPVVTAFRMLVILIIIKAVTNPIYMFILNVFSLTKKAVILSILLSLVTAILDILLIPVYGYKGAIIAGVTGYLFWIIGSLFITKIREMVPVKGVGKSIVCISLVLIIFYIFNLLGLKNPYVLALVLMSCYFVFLLLIGEVDKQDIAIVKRMISAPKDIA